MPILELKELKELLPKGKRLMGIDHGSKTWGLAVSTPELNIATALTTIKRTKFSLDIVKLANLCKDYNIGGFIIGLPLNMDGTEGPRVDSVRHFGVNLINAQDALGFEPLIAFFDERLSSSEITDFLWEQNIRHKNHKKVIDKLAAQTILQGALKKILPTK